MSVTIDVGWFMLIGTICGVFAAFLILHYKKRLDKWDWKNKLKGLWK
jgi:hypothetical protein